jgi:glutamate dehydrogenase
MYYVNAELQRQIIAEVIELVEKNYAKDEAAIISKFAQFYYSKVADSDLAARDVNDLYGSMLSMWKFLTARKKPDERTVRVFNPEFEQDGWDSSHTVIEIAMENMPFLLDSLRLELSRLGCTIYLIVCPGGIAIDRDKKKVKAIDVDLEHSEKRVDGVPEVPIFIEINRQPDAQTLNEIKAHIDSVLDDVSVAVADWEEMCESSKELLAQLDNEKINTTGHDLQEAVAFVKWVSDNNFTFLGVADYDLDAKGHLQHNEDSNLGLTRTKKYTIRKLNNGGHANESDLCDTNTLIWLQQLTNISSVHRSSRPYCVAVKRFDKNGDYIGERRLYGLFTSAAYHSNPRNIPLLRNKVNNVIKRAGFELNDHNGRILFNILETYPRDELFQINQEDLLDISLGIMHMQERPQVRLFIRKDYYDRYFSCLIYVPRERFNSKLREKMSDILMEAFGGERVDFMTYFSESILARIHLMIYLPEDGHAPEYDPKVLEEKIIDCSRTWIDDLHTAIVEHFGESHGFALYEKYKNGFLAGYQESYTPKVAVHDIEHMEALGSDQDIQMSFYRPIEQDAEHVNFRLFVKSNSIPLSDVLPLLENMGFKVMAERNSRINTSADETFWISEFVLMLEKNGEFDITAVKDDFQEAFAKTWQGFAENDGFNSLIIRAGLDWRETACLRAYAKYFRQIGLHFSQVYIEETLVLYPEITRTLVSLFHAYFNVNEQGDDDTVKALEENLLKMIDAVSNLDQDRIFRCFLASIKATLRTNFYQADQNGNDKPYISFKVKSAEIPEVPEPYPQYEIFVYSPRIEGVHLRGAKVARGGLRWSDRREDFRTEILGLMKAQQVKNAVIVPAGAKGGFVVKQMPNGSREEMLNEGIACYKTFIRGLLDITDNLNGDEVLHPLDVVRRDEDDPYLVVAADKGTATFSDIANEVAAEYNFWMGDAFASGGSQGYDHKKMGITARGAWESVKRHFRELGKDIQNEDFTVVGIGDMAGDVFGNGMLLSTHIRLVAAFNHQHIFLDPNPDADTTYKERKRLFNMPRSSWADYNTDVISEGGGVYRRSAKSIPISNEVKALLNINADQLAPNDLIRAILKAPVDLLWNGGIGTYVKAKSEQNTEVGDRANDPLRVNGVDLRCKVVGEGGNLGCTQLGRIEYALNGGIIYTDFIDNAGGVDCSDHEVNIKILLDSVVANGDMTEKQRNELLVLMTDEVAELVLENNYQQTQALSISTQRSNVTFDEYVRFMSELERTNWLNRRLEFLPTDKTIIKRRAEGLGFTRPELAVLLSYSKIYTKMSLTESDLLDDEALLPYLQRAFPERLSKRFMSQLMQHKLRKEIIATQLANAITNRMGATFIKRVYDETGADTADVARAYIVANEIFGMNELWESIQALDNKVSALTQISMMVRLIRLIRRGTRWFLRNRRAGIDIVSNIKDFKPKIDGLYKDIADVLAGEELEKLYENTANYEAEGVPHDLALRVASTRGLISALDIVDAALCNKQDVNDVARVYFTVGARLHLDWFRARIAAHEVNNNWDALARAACRDDIDRQQRSITESILHFCKTRDDVAQGIETWESGVTSLVERWMLMLSDLKSTASEDFTMYAVALRELLDLAQTSQSVAAKS